MVSSHSYGEFLSMETKRQWKWEKQHAKELQFYADALPYAGGELGVTGCSKVTQILSLVPLSLTAYALFVTCGCVLLSRSRRADPVLRGGGSRQLLLRGCPPAVLGLVEVQGLVEVAHRARPAAHCPNQVCAWRALCVVVLMFQQL